MTAIKTGLIFTSFAFLLSACATVAAPDAPKTQDNSPSARMANPASLNCLQQRGKLQTLKTSQGEVTYCLLPSGKKCEEWDMFRGNCPVRTVNANRKFGNQSTND